MKTKESSKKMIISILISASVSIASALCIVGLKANQEEINSPDINTMRQNLYQNTSYPSSHSNPDFTFAAEKSVHAVVHIKSITRREVNPSFIDPFEFFFGNPRLKNQIQEIPSFGSGVIISEDGYIITNHHVVENAGKVEVTLNDNRNFEAKIVGSDPNTDIALLKIDAKNLAIIPFGNSDSLKIGEWVLAVGNPFNLTSTVTAGIVSAKGRGSLFDGSNTKKIESFIQTDAAVNRGNSGGALVNISGELVGINTAIYSQTGNYTGYSFAIPISIAAKVAKDIKEYGTVQRAVMGVSIRNVDAALVKEKDLKIFEGVYVHELIEGGSAEKAGIKAGDVITHINQTKIRNSGELQEQIGRFRPSDEIKVQIKRNNEDLVVNVLLKNLQGNTAIVENKGIEILDAEFNILSDNLKKKYGISNGIIVKSIRKNGKFHATGIQEGYIILSANNTKINRIDDLENVIKEVRNSFVSDQVLVLKGFYPNGKTAFYALDLSE